MSTTEATNVNAKLKSLVEAGVSPWLDYLQRSLITGGELQRLIDEDSLRGNTSNPSIFEKAILGSSDDYDEDLHELFDRGQGLSPQEIYEDIAIKDVQMACDVHRATWEATHHQDGFVSLEVSADIAYDTEASITGARDFWKRVNRPNLMIKIPGTKEGVGPIEEAIYAGLNINITLLFAVDAYEAVAEAYLKGLEKRLAAGESLDIASVASFFVSRVDSAVDKRLEASGHTELLGTAAVANARLAYRKFEEHFEPTVRGGRRSITRALTTSARCGPRPAPRTPRTQTPSTSTSSWQRTRSTRCRSTRCRRSATTGTSRDRPPSTTRRRTSRR